MDAIDNPYPRDIKYINFMNPTNVANKFAYFIKGSYFITFVKL